MFFTPIPIISDIFSLFSVLKSIDKILPVDSHVIVSANVKIHRNNISQKFVFPSKIVGSADELKLYIMKVRHEKFINFSISVKFLIFSFKKVCISSPNIQGITITNVIK